MIGDLYSPNRFDTRLDEWASAKCQTLRCQLIVCKCYLTCAFISRFRQRDKLEDMLRDLTPERAKIAKCMVFCVNHADCAEEVILNSADPPIDTSCMETTL